MLFSMNAKKTRIHQGEGRSTCFLCIILYTIYYILYSTALSDSVVLLILSMYVCMYGHTYSKSMDQSGKVANSARGRLNRKNEYFPVRVRA